MFRACTFKVLVYQKNKQILVYSRIKKNDFEPLLINCTKKKNKEMINFCIYLEGDLYPVSR